MEEVLNLKKLNKVLVFVLVTALFVTSSFTVFKSESDVKASDTSVASHVNNPRRPANVTTWDCVYFGHYNQTKNKMVTDSYSGDYFPEPIKWRVLEKDEENNELFLMADQSLDSMQYNETDNKTNSETGAVDLSWANSDLRTWLNDDFYNAAFDEEKADVNLTSSEANADDYVYVLSKAEATNKKYGFINGTGSTDTRCAVNEDYCYREHSNRSGNAVINNGVDNPDTNDHKYDEGKILSKTYGVHKNCGIWWLRTESNEKNRVYRVDYDGRITTKVTTDRNVCVRPVIRVKADSQYLRYAGTVKSNGEETGSCGNNGEVLYSVNNNTLTIYGTGQMDDFRDFEAPWHKYYESIYTIVVKGNVTSVSSHAFEDCMYASYMYLSNNVIDIASDAFCASGPYNEELLISVGENTSAHNRVAELGWNYTNVRSEEPLCKEILSIHDTIQTSDTLSFTFDNPCAGQTYEVYMDGTLKDTIVDDIHNSKDAIKFTIDGITEGTHTIEIKAMVQGSNPNVAPRRSAGHILRIKDTGFGNPEWISKPDDLVRWERVEFGRYPQTKSDDGDYTDPETGEKYKTEPIKWRILEVKNNELLLIADKSLDNRIFGANHDWETCELRSWLNDYNYESSHSDKSFINRAFNAEEKALLQTVATPSNTSANTQDKVFCLNVQEAQNYDYGFLDSFTYTKSRRANATDYAGRNNDETNSTTLVYTDIATYDHPGKDPSDNYHKKSTIWWLRDKFGKTESACRVNFPGNTEEGKKPTDGNACVRPCIRVPADSKLLKDVGTIDSYGNETEVVKKCEVRIDGQLVDKVTAGSSYTLPTGNNMRLLMAANNTSNTNIGYIDDADQSCVYDKGYTMTIEEDKSFSTITKVTAEPYKNAVRLVQGEPHGLAFACKATVTTRNNESGNPIHTEAFEYGTLVTTYDDYASVYDNDLNLNTKQIDGHRIYNVKFREQDFSEDPQTYIVGITNLQKHNYAREFVAIPYVLIHFVGEDTPAVVYPNSQTPLFVKSAKATAENLMSKKKWRNGQYSPWEMDWIRSYTILD